MYVITCFSFVIALAFLLFGVRMIHKIKHLNMHNRKRLIVQVRLHAPVLTAYHSPTFA